MIELILSLALAGVLILFVVIGMLWGLKRGLKKTLFRAAWLAVTAILLFLLTPVLTRAALSADISALGLSAGGESISTLQEYVTAMLGQNEMLGQLAAENPQAVSSLMQIVSLGLNVFVFVLLFWGLKIVLWPIWAVFSAVFIRKRRPDGQKKPQHRLWGMLAGAVLGLLVCMVTLTPLTGSIGFALRVEEQTRGSALAARMAGEGQADPDKGIVLQAAGEENARYVELYADSVGLKIFRYTGMEALSGLIYGGLTSGRINGVRVSLTDGVLTALSAAERGLGLLDTSFENLTKEEISQVLDSLRQLNEELFSIGILTAAGSELLPYALAKAADGGWGTLPDLGTPGLNAALSDTLRSLKDLTFSDLKDEIDRVLDLGELLNDRDILPDLLAGGEPDLQTLAGKVDGELAAALAEVLFSMKTVTAAFPAFLEAGLDYAVEIAGGTLPEGEAGSATVEQMKAFLTELLTDGAELYLSLDPDSDYYLTRSSLALAGSLLDAVRQYPGIGADRYAALVDAFEVKVKTALEDALADPGLEGVLAVLLELTDGLSEADSFGADFAALGEKFDDFTAFADGMRAEPAEVRLAELGGVLDGFAQTALFGDSLNELLSAGLDFLKTKLPADFASLSDSIESMKTRLSQVESWREELSCYTGLFEVIGEVGGEGFDPGTLFGQTDDLLERFGAALDEAEAAVLLQPELKTVFELLLDRAGEALNGSAPAEVMLDGIRQNLRAADALNWTAEFSALKRLGGEVRGLSDSLTAEEVSALGATLDGLAQSLLLAGYGSDQAVDVRQSLVGSLLDEIAGGQTDEDIRGLVTDMKTALTSIVRYETEFAALSDFVDRVEELQNADMTAFSLAGFGAALDGYADFEGQGRAVLICAVRERVVTLAVDRVNIDVTGTDIPREAVDEILANAKACAALAEDGTLTYQRLFGDLDELRTKAENPPEVEVTRQSADVTGLGTYLDELKLLCVVPLRSAVRISQSLVAAVAEAADELEGVAQALADPEVQRAREAVKAETDRLDALYAAALSEGGDLSPWEAEGAFEAEYAVLTGLLTELLAALDGGIAA